MPTNATYLLDIDAVLARTGTGRTKHYEDINCGLFAPPVRRGSRFSRWPSDEVDAVVRARVAGCDDSAVKQLVAKQISARHALISHQYNAAASEAL